MPRRIYVQLHLLVALASTTSVFGKLISLSAPSLVAWRTLFASLGAAFLVAVISRKSLRLPGRKIAALLGIGVIIGLHWICFFGAIKLANISICLAGIATISLFTAFTEPLLEKRPIRPLEVLLGLLVFAGIALIAGFEQAHRLGLGVALLGAFFAAIFPVLNRWQVNQGQHDPMIMVAWEMAGACLICLVCVGVFEGQAGFVNLFQFHGLDWLWLLFLGWACTVFAFGWHIHLLRRLSAYTTNLAFNFEPIYGIAAAALIFGEHHRLHPAFFVGTAAILVANILHPLVLRWFSHRNLALPVSAAKDSGK